VQGGAAPVIKKSAIGAVDCLEGDDGWGCGGALIQS